MVKTLRISLDDDEHTQLTKAKGPATWRDVLYVGCGQPIPEPRVKGRRKKVRN